jgi:hypothetical protein
MKKNCLVTFLLAMAAIHLSFSAAWEKKHPNEAAITVSVINASNILPFFN